MTPLNILAAFAAAAIGSFACSAAVRRYALRTRLLDVPNARSSHATPVPRGGGAAIVVVALLGVAVAVHLDAITPRAALGFAGPGLVLAIVGLVDDRRGLAAGLRFTVQVGVVGAALALLGHLPPVVVGPYAWSDPIALHAFYGLALLWSINLFNFMDGIDGIAGVEGFTVAGGLAALLVLAGSAGPALVPTVLAGAAAGFLPLNWAPARTFMGDVGSGFLGFALPYSALAAAPTAPWAFPVVVCLGAIFVGDATATLLARLSRGERVSLAHRTHAYQRLSRHWGSHARVSLVIGLANVALLVPLAAAASRWPELAWPLAVAATVAAALAAHALGAGMPGEISASGVTMAVSGDPASIDARPDSPRIGR